MIGAGLLPHRVAGQLARRDVDPLGQPTHRDRRRAVHVVGYESQPRQRAQLHSSAQDVRRTAKLAHERIVRLGQREVADQLRARDLRETAQSSQIFLGECTPSRHPSSNPPNAIDLKASES